jgi:hypothetical protein
MAKPFDATLKHLIDTYAADWAVYLAARIGVVPSGPIMVIDADLSSSLQADKLFALGPLGSGVLHLELQSSWEAGVPDRILRYNVIADDRHGPPVFSVLVLLRREANASDITGQLRRVGPDGTAYLEFRYRVIRLWEEPLAPLLAGGHGLLPLAVLTDEAGKDLAGTVRRCEEQLAKTSAQPDEVRELRLASFILLGLRYDKDVIRELYKGVKEMKESSTYQYIFGEGKLEGKIEATHDAILTFGEFRLGQADASVRAALSSVTDLDRLLRMQHRLPQVTDWNELLATE